MKNFKDYTIRIEGKLYLAEHFKGVDDDSSISPQLSAFLEEWYNDSDVIEVQTSGSTGKPERMLVEKQKMLNSAKITCSFLELKENDTVLLCMPLEYIAGKMMVVRSLYAGLDLWYIESSGSPLAEFGGKINFSAMTPMQVYNSLANDIECGRLKAIDKLLIGGAPIDMHLAQELKSFPSEVYSTYGMTETLSHVALRRLSGADASEYYTVFDFVRIESSDENSLIIDAPLVSDEVLYTNDIVEINSKGQFKVLGRRDNVINSGGIKIQIEELEKELRQYIQQSFAISSIDNDKLGEVVVLVLEKELEDDSFLKSLDKYSQPKRTVIIEKIPMTGTNKIARGELRNLLSERL